MTTTNPHSLPVYLLPTHKDGLGLDCTRYEAVMWNPYNGVVQCHACGTVFVASDYGRAAGEASAPGASPADENFARLADQARQVGAVLKVEDSSDAVLPDPFAEAAGASSSAAALPSAEEMLTAYDATEGFGPGQMHLARSTHRRDGFYGFQLGVGWARGVAIQPQSPYELERSAALPTEEANDG